MSNPQALSVRSWRPSVEPTGPLKWRKPAIVEIAEDVFGESFDDAARDRVFAIMALTPQHKYLLSTAWPERMAGYLSTAGLVRRLCVAADEIAKSMRKYRDDLDEFHPINRRHWTMWAKQFCPPSPASKLTAWLSKGGCAADYFEKTEPDREYPSWVAWPLPNLLLGVPVSDQQQADERIPWLLKCPAVCRYVDVTFGGAVDLDLSGGLPRPLYTCQKCGDQVGAGEEDYRGRHPYCGGSLDPEGSTDALDFVRCSGETGKDAKPCHPQWPRALRDQCAAAGVAFSWRGWGEWKPISEMPESEYQPYYVSRRKAREWEDQDSIDELEGRRCTIPVSVIRFDGSVDSTMFTSVGGFPAYQTFRVGAKKSGRLLDGQVHDALPEVLSHVE